MEKVRQVVKAMFTNNFNNLPGAWSLALLNAVKCNLTKLTIKKSWHSLGSQRLLVGSACTEKRKKKKKKKNLY